MSVKLSSSSYSVQSEEVALVVFTGFVPPVMFINAGKTDYKWDTRKLLIRKQLSHYWKQLLYTLGVFFSKYYFFLKNRASLTN